MTADSESGWAALRPIGTYFEATVPIPIHDPHWPGNVRLSMVVEAHVMTARGWMEEVRLVGRRELPLPAGATICWSPRTAEWRIKYHDVG